MSQWQRHKHFACNLILATSILKIPFHDLTCLYKYFPISFVSTVPSTLPISILRLLLLLQFPSSFQYHYSSFNPHNKILINT